VSGRKQINYFLSEALNSFSRHKAMSVAALITMAAALGVFALFLFVTVNVDEVVRGVEERKQIIAYLTDDTGESDVQLLKSSLEGMAGIASVEYISKDQAWEEFRAELDDDALLAAVDTNPLPASFRLSLTEDAKAALEMETLVGQISKFPGVEEVQYGEEWVRRLDDLTVTLTIANLMIGLVVSLCVIFVISNTIRLTVLARRDLIEVMKLVGATESFIRAPFLIEGIAQGLSAGVLALLIILVGERAAETRLSDLAYLRLPQILGFLLFSAFLGWVGSFLSLRSVLRRIGSA
jgi:cell division transport system permease protein